MPGIVDSTRDTWVRGLQISGVNRIDIADVVRFTGLPVHIEDYTRALAFYELTAANGRDVSDFVIVNLGLGVGAGLVVDRAIYRGLHGLSGEIGHITVNPNGRRCGCGMIGCLETVCSVPGIQESIRRLADAGVYTDIAIAATPPDVDAIKRFLDEGDRLAVTVVSEATDALVTGLATLTKIMNPQRIIVSGPGSVLFRDLKETIAQELRRSILPEMEQDLEIVFARYDSNQEAWGASLLAVDRYWPGRVPDDDRE